MMYDVTIRDNDGNAVVAGFEIEDGNVTINQILNSVRAQEYIEKKIREFRNDYRGIPLRYILCPEKYIAPPEPFSAKHVIAAMRRMYSKEALS